jgi:hypothetical protein
MNALIMFFFVGCGPEVQAPSCDSSEDSACFKGVFRTLLGQPVEGIQVCVLEDDEFPCVVTDELGQWKIPGLPLDTNVALTAEHPDFVPSLFGQFTGMAWYDWYKVAIPKSIMSTNANRLDLELDETKGNVLFLTWEGLNINGIDTANVPDVVLTNAADFDNVFYGDALGLASTSQESTTGSGSGGILNLPVGINVLHLESPFGECAKESMFHYQSENEGIPIPIRAGFTSAIDIICPISE